MEDKQSRPLREKIHEFFENPKGALAVGVQLFILALIVLSVILAVMEEFYPEIAQKHVMLLEPVNRIILIIFTIEYLLRVSTAPRKVIYVIQPLNVVDFLSIFPGYVEIVLNMSVDYSLMGMRGIRILRFMRFARFIRGLRLLRFLKTLSRAFQYEDTVLQAITPMILLGIFLKAAIWSLEYQDMWITNPSLGDLFAIIGFALGIILSQKIGVSYDKFVKVEEASVRIYGSLQTLCLTLNRFGRGVGFKACGEWAQAFLRIVEDADADNYSIHEHNRRLHDILSEYEKAPADLFDLHVQLCCDASFCLSKKVRLTPKAYDTLLHQATVIYLLLIAVFIPGLTGMISVMVATYILYGMYHLTKDLDSIVGGEYNLINIDLSELRYFTAECMKNAEKTTTDTQ